MLKKLQFVFLFIFLYAKRHKKYLIVGFLAGFFTCLIFFQVYPFYRQSINPEKRKIGIVGQFNERNLPLSIQIKISLGLTSILPSGEAIPSLAHNWNIDSNDLSYTFSLDNNARWHDGTSLVAKDIDYKFKDVVFTPVSNNILKVTLKEPYSPLLTYLSKPLFKPGLTGLGNYKVIQITYTGEYISELALSPLLPGLSPIIYKFYPNTEESILAFKMGEIDILENLNKLEDLKSWPNIKISEISQYDRIVAVFLNYKNSFFKEKEIRQALNYAIPPFENYEKAYTPISPLSFAYSNRIRLYKYDQEAAKKILSKSLLSSSSSELTVSTYASLLPVAQSISDAWNKVGVNTKVKVENSLPSEYQVFVLTFMIPADPDQYQFWQSTQEGTNITRYSNLKIDKLLEDGRKTQDKELRKKIYADFQRYLVDDSPVLFLYYPKVYNVERNK